MGRECRRVPADWQHPKDEHGRYLPLLDETYEDALRRWNEGAEHFERGEEWDYDKKCWGPRCEESKGYTFAGWHGDPPNPKYHRPAYTSEPTHFQMYEDTSEGTPISPVFATAEECARWCADNGASAFGDMTADYDHWINVIKGTAGIGFGVDQATGEKFLT